MTELGNDLAYALASTDIRILAPIPGKQAVGVEVPNTRRRIVRLGDIYAGRPQKTSPLVAWLGKGIDGNPVWTDISKMPHVLVAGTTGSGKSGCVNAILSSILMQASPNEVRLVLVDPKQVELNHYENVPHLLTPVVTSPRLAANVLANLIGEMESRYGIMGQARCRNLDELNRARAKAGEAPLPHILCVIDELADLMMVAPAEVEDSIIRLAQKSRATGIHLVLATQRPSTDIITGTIKVNIPARIAFAVSSQTDSRVILDQGGAEALLGQGDMLFRGAGTSKLQRIQGAFITEEEIARITRHWAKQGEPEFEEELLETREVVEEGVEAGGEFDPDADDLLDEAIRIVVETETASVSMIQRRLRVGYTRAGRLIDMLERRGVISGYEGSKPRQVLITQADLSRVLGGGVPSRSRPRPTPSSDARSNAFRLRRATMRGWAKSEPPCEKRAPPRGGALRGRSGDQDPPPLPLAIENEAWEVLPGPAYAAGFVRAYAELLGLDGARMAAECPLRPSPPRPGGEPRAPARRVPRRGRRQRRPDRRDRRRRPALGRRRRRRSAVSTRPRGARRRRAGERPRLRRLASGGQTAHQRPSGSAADGAEPDDDRRTLGLPAREDGKPLVDGLVLPSGGRRGAVPFR